MVSPFAHVVKTPFALEEFLQFFFVSKTQEHDIFKMQIHTINLQQIHAKYLNESISHYSLDLLFNGIFCSSYPK